MKTSKNTSSKTSAKPKPTKRAPKQKAEKTLPQLLANLARLIRYDTEDVVATRINGLWDSICQRNRAAEEVQRKRIAELEYEIGQRNSLVGQRGFELRAAQEEIAVLQRKLAHAESETKEARKLHRVPQMVQLEIESLRMELDKERAATKAVRAHATYGGEQLRRDMAKRDAEKDAALAAALEDERTHLSLLRILLERESGEHFATRIRLRDALRDAAERAREVADYAEKASETAYGKDVREIAATYDETRAALGLDEIAMPPAAGERTNPVAEAIDRQMMGYAESKGEPAQQPARRRRFRAGDRVRLPAQTTVYSAVLDENDAGSVAIEVSRNELNCISTSALTLIEPTHCARRNRELAFHFHRWSISTDADAMDSVPEFVRVAAEQLLRDPFGTEYGSVLADAGAKTGGAK